MSDCITVSEASGEFLTMNTEEFWVSSGIPMLGMVVALVCLVFALRAGSKKRLVDNIPTSKTTGVFIGLVELKGSAESESPVHGFLSGKPCVHHTWSVEEHWSRTVTETYRDSKGHTRTRTRRDSGWKTVASGGESSVFYLQDDCGVIRIVPEGAKIEPALVLQNTCTPLDPMYYGKGPATAVAHSDHRRRFSEHAIPLHAPIYVMGQSRERDDIVAPEIARSDQAPLFLISVRSEERVRLGYRITYWVLAVLGLVSTLAGLFIAKAAPATCVLAGAGYLVAWMLGWLWMVYNSMVNLRQRVRQAWSNVDVELKRRYDLIPNLVRVVEAMRGHEQQTQETVARMRTQMDATAPGEPGPEPAGFARSLIALSESYPDLKANDTFLKLQDELVDTEHRIALARGYYNDIATFYNTRLEILPDRYVCAMGKLQPVGLLGANDFERVPVEVRLVQD
jgi:hypothetical protein